MGTHQRIQIIKETEGTGWDSNPRRRITGAVSSPLDDQCMSSFFAAVGPEGLEPSPTWLRARRSAARALVPIIRPFDSARKELNLRLPVISRVLSL